MDGEIRTLLELHSQAVEEEAVDSSEVRNY